MSMEGTVVVTGNSRFIGSAVVRRLPHAGYTVVGFDLKGPAQSPSGLTFVEMDTTSDESVRAGLERVRADHGSAIACVVHLAAYYDFSGAPSPKYQEITVNSTKRLLQALQSFEVRQFAFSSTQLVYAPSEPGERISEDSPPEPKWPYPQSKVEIEEVIRTERGDIPAVFMRLAGVYTDHCHQPALAHQIQRIRERRLTARVFPGSTAHGQPLMHRDVLVEAVAAIVDRRADLPPEWPVLLGEPETMTYDALQHTLARLIHGEGDWDTREIPKAVAKAGAWLEGLLPGEEPFIQPWMIDIADDHWELDITRARTLLGWEPKHSLRDMLPRMMEFLKADPRAFYKENKLTPLPDQEAADGA
jgi:nucleoside-diphosphate-sugar epimerase